MPQALQTALLVIFPALVIIAAFKDATSFRIPNWISAAAVLAFFPTAFLIGLPIQTIGLHAGVGLAGLVIGMVMFALRWIGGGDAKLLAAAMLWLGWPAAGFFLLITAVAGGVLSVALLNLRADWLRSWLPAGPAWVERLRESGGDVPYGVAIAVGALIAFPQTVVVTALTG
jgi:prepilin peptidase CpaA